MNTYKYLNPLPAICRSLDQTISSLKGNVLVYLIVVVLIFGVLGVTIVSLFTTATSSSATPNDSRRAYYVAESGIRYALSEIRNSNFNDNFIESLNTTPSYNLTDGGSFTINIFSPFFVSNSDQDTSASTTFTFNVPNNGEIPQNFAIPSSIWAVNWTNFDNSPNTYSQINSSVVNTGDTSLTITFDDTYPLIADTDDIVCLAVNPLAGVSLQAGANIIVPNESSQFFPPANGAIRIFTVSDGQYYDGYYENIESAGPGQWRLTNIAALPGASLPDAGDGINLTTSDYVILSRYNYRLLATGKSGDVEIEIGNNKPLNIFSDVGSYTIYESELIEDSSIKEWYENLPIIKTDVVEEEITLGGSGRAFGDLWYGGDKPIGNDNNFCQEGRCFFGIGIRAFFTLDYSGNGEGFIFALISAGGDPSENTANSAGGDFQRSELLGYAGDSRTVADGTVTVDNTGDGLLPPKLGLEFDTRTNFDSNFEQTLNYCSDATTLMPDTRNDPLLPGDPPTPTHAVQNVFWGNTDLTGRVPCRGNDQTYDDNRHEAEGPTEKWTFTNPPTAAVQSSPAIGPDGTIYVGSNDGHLYAVDPDNGTEKWRFPSSGSVGEIRSSPAIAADGTIYVGSGTDGIGSDGRVFALNPADREANLPFPSANEWEFSPPGGLDNDVDSSPAIDANGNIYIGSDDGFLYGIDEDGNELWNFPAIEQVESRPAISESRTTVYFESESRFLYALNIADGSLLWTLDIDRLGGVFDDDELESSPTIGADGTIYVGSKDGRLYAVNHDDRLADPVPPVSNFPTANEWTFNTGAAVRSTPAIDPNDGTIYFGSDNGNVYAINPNGAPKGPPWPFSTSGPVRSSPIIDSNGTIYIGSDDGRLFAINSDGTERWRFPVETEPPIGEIRSSPAIGSDSTVYFGSNDNKLNAVTPFAVPRNIRGDPDKEQNDPDIDPDLDNKLIISDDFSAVTFTTPAEWLKEGPWAVRMEMTRAPSSEGPGIEGTYTLKTWFEKCDGDCTVFTDGLFRDTRVVYNVAGRPPKLEQTFTISDTDHEKFERFLFGFTTAAQAVDDQQAIIRDFELTFSRPGDPVVTID